MKYIVIDFGKVIAGPCLENWFIMPKFHELVGDISMDILSPLISKHNHHFSYIMKTEEDEYHNFYNFFKDLLKDLNKVEDEAVIKALAHDWTYNDDKFKFYDNVEKELEHLSAKYKIILLSEIGRAHV